MTLAEYAQNLLPTLTEAQANSVAVEYAGLEGGNVTAQAVLIYGEGKLSYHISTWWRAMWTNDHRITSPHNLSYVHAAQRIRRSFS